MGLARGQCIHMHSAAAYRVPFTQMCVKSLRQQSRESIAEKKGKT